MSHIHMYSGDPIYICIYIYVCICIYICMGILQGNGESNGKEDGT